MAAYTVFRHVRKARSIAKFELLSLRLYYSSFIEFGIKIVVIMCSTTLKSYNLWGNLSFKTWLLDIRPPQLLGDSPWNKQTLSNDVFIDRFNDSFGCFWTKINSTLSSVASESTSTMSSLGGYPSCMGSLSESTFWDESWNKLFLTMYSMMILLFLKQK